MHEHRTVGAHNRIPLDERPDQQVARATARGQIRTQIKGDEWLNYIDSPFPAEKNFLVGLINELHEINPSIDSVQRKGRILEVLGIIPLQIIGDVKAGTCGRSAVKETGESKVHRRQVVRPNGHR